LPSKTGCDSAAEGTTEGAARGPGRGAHGAATSVRLGRGCARARRGRGSPGAGRARRGEGLARNGRAAVRGGLAGGARARREGRGAAGSPPRRAMGQGRARGGRGAGERLAREGLAGGQRAGRMARRSGTRQGARATWTGEGRVQGKKKEEGGGRERREGEGKTHLRGIQTPAILTPNPNAPRGERERGGRGRWRLLRGRNQMRQMDQGKGGCARMGRAGGARGTWAGSGPDRAGLGHIADRNPRHARPLNGIQS
jgi:hypothetical protein